MRAARGALAAVLHDRDRARERRRTPRREVARGTSRAPGEATRHCYCGARVEPGRVAFGALGEQALDARRSRTHDRELQRSEQQSLADYGDAPERTHDQTRERLRTILHPIGKLRVEARSHFVRGHLRIEHHRMARMSHVRHRGLVVLVVDVADELLEQVLERRRCPLCRRIRRRPRQSEIVRAASRTASRSRAWSPARAAPREAAPCARRRRGSTSNTCTTPTISSSEPRYTGTRL